MLHRIEYLLYLIDLKFLKLTQIHSGISHRLQLEENYLRKLSHRYHNEVKNNRLVLFRKKPSLIT